MGEGGVSVRRRRIDRGVKVRSESIYCVDSLKEILYLLAPRALLVLGVLALPLLVPGLYWKKVLCIVGIYGLLAVSMDFLANYVGLICLGTAFFVGVGGYVSGLLSVLFELPLWVTVPTATLFGGAFCTLAFLPCLRLRGVYFAVVSFVYPLAASKLVVATNSFGGTDGITGVGMFTNIWWSQYLILGLALLCTFGLRRLANEDVGIVFRGVRDNDQSIRAAGMSVTRYKSLALFLGASMGCLAGAFLSHLYGWVGVSLFSLDFSIFPVTAVVVGGPGTLAGPLLGALILVPLSESLRSFSELRIVFYSLLIVFFIIFWREGLLNWARRLYEQTETLEEV